MNQNEKNVKAYKDQVQHDIMLRAEKRRLREADMKETQERLKRLEWLKKQKIIEKEQKAAKKLQAKKKDLEYQRNLILNNSVIGLVERDNLKKTVMEVCHTISPKKKEMLVTASPAKLAIKTDQFKKELGLAKKKEQDE